MGGLCCGYRAIAGVTRSDARVVVGFGGFSFHDDFSNFLQFSSETSGLPKNRNMNKNPRVSGGGLFTVI